MAQMEDASTKDLLPYPFPFPLLLLAMTPSAVFFYASPNFFVHSMHFSAALDLH